MTITTTIPYSREQIGLDLQYLEVLGSNADGPDSTSQPVQFHWNGVTQDVYDLLLRWSTPGLAQSAHKVSTQEVGRSLELQTV